MFDIQKPIDLIVLIVILVVLASPVVLVFSFFRFFKGVKTRDYSKSIAYGSVFLFFALFDILSMLIVLSLRSGGPVACCS